MKNGGLNIIKKLLVFSLLFFIQCKQEDKSVLYYLSQQEKCDNYKFSKKITIEGNNLCYINFDTSAEANRQLVHFGGFGCKFIHINSNYDLKKTKKDLAIFFAENKNNNIGIQIIYYKYKRDKEVKDVLGEIFSNYELYIKRKSLEKYNLEFSKLEEKLKLELIDEYYLQIAASKERIQPPPPEIPKSF